MKAPKIIRNKAQKLMNSIVVKVSEEIFTMMKCCQCDMNMSIDELLNDSDDYNTFMSILNHYYKDYNERKEEV